jgi:hypothetical protein
MKTLTDLVTKIMRWENGEMTERETLEFFAELIQSGTCWHLQGCYGRTANDFIQSGLIDDKGNITQKGKNLLNQSEEE